MAKGVTFLDSPPPLDRLYITEHVHKSVEPAWGPILQSGQQDTVGMDDILPNCVIIISNR